MAAECTPAAKILVREGDMQIASTSLRKGDAMKTLGDVKVHGEGALRRHLMDLGLIKGTSFKVVKVAPLGDPVEINVRGYELSIRKEEAAVVEVQ